MRPRGSALPTPPRDPSVTQVLGLPTHNFVAPYRSPPPPVPPAAPDAPISVVWFRGHDLRVHDHAALDAAVASRGAVVALYVLECGAETDGAATYNHRRRPPRTSAEPADSAAPPELDAFSSMSDVSAPVPDGGFTREASPTRIPLESERDPWGPLSPNGGFALGRVPRWYLHHSLRVLREQLHRLGITLVLRRVDCADDTAVQVTSVAKALRAGSVFWNKRYKPRAYPVDEAVKSSLRKLGIYTQDFDSETLMEPSMTICGRYNDFQSYTRFWIDAMRAAPPPRPHDPIRPEDVISIPREQVQQLLSQSECKSLSVRISPECAKLALPSVADLGLLQDLSVDGSDSPGSVKAIGCTAARALLDSFLEEERFARFASGQARRDGMVIGEDLTTSRISPHVRFGEISPRVLFYAVVDTGAEAEAKGNLPGLEAARTFLKNMSLREFGYYMLTRYPSAAYKPIMPEFDVFPWAEDEDGALMRAWETGTTGFPIVDAAMRQLLREGWLHNRMRFLAASFFCKYLLLPWPVGAAHLVRTLVDGDEACNSLGWQWTVGCNSDSFPFSTLVNPLSLYTHTQSRSRAANYVRKYVPELSHLPDHLVFTPWKATIQERKLFNLNIVPLREYNEVTHVHRDLPNGHGHGPQYYPARVVTGKDARFRARRAMEVMRRIFAAQRQCRTIIAEQFPLSSARKNNWRAKSPLAEKKKKRRVVSGVLATDADGKTIVELDISNVEASVPCVSEVTTAQEETAVDKDARRRDEPDVQVEQSRKRRRTSSPAREVEEARRETTMRTSAMLSIAQLSSPDAEVPQSFRNEAAATRVRPRETTLTDSKVLGDGAQKISVVNGSGESVKIAPASTSKNAKRPRPTTPQMGIAADERLSVQSLLSPNLSAHDVGTTHGPQTPSLQHAAPEPTGASPGHISRLPDLARVASQQRPARGHGITTNGPTTPDLLGSLPLNFTHRSPPFVAENRQSASAPRHLSTPREDSGGRRPATLHRPPSDNAFPGQPSGFVGQPSLPAFQMRNGHERPSKPSGGAAGSSDAPSRMEGVSGVQDAETERLPASAPYSNRKRARPGPVPNFDVQRTQPSLFQSPIQMVGNQFQRPHHGQQAMLQYGPPGNPLHMPHMNHAPSPMQAPGVSQGGYFTHPHQTAGQPVVWYSPMAPMPQYMDLRTSTLPNTILPHMVHPMARQHPQALPMGYAVPRGTGVPPQDPRVVGGNPLPVPYTDNDNGARRGPSSPMEREQIARRMAAMDYKDEHYGGKHWEQWQAIALHLLNQYEFSDDTDRETSKAYVRLCVLKDELRDANPNGPRVTVNHCKEVFRILNLPVTGEWDRRGHGGVRGPYVYGCVKRSGAHVSRR